MRSVGHCQDTSATESPWHCDARLQGAFLRREMLGCMRYADANYVEPSDKLYPCIQNMFIRTMIVEALSVNALRRLCNGWCETDVGRPGPSRRRCRSRLARLAAQRPTQRHGAQLYVLHVPYPMYTCEFSHPPSLPANVPTLVLISRLLS
jgi:hypothetical protein